MRSLSSEGGPCPGILIEAGALSSNDRLEVTDPCKRWLRIKRKLTCSRLGGPGESQAPFWKILIK